MTKGEALDKAISELNSLSVDYEDGFGYLSVHPEGKFFEVGYTDPADQQHYWHFYYWK